MLHDDQGALRKLRDVVRVNLVVPPRSSNRRRESKREILLLTARESFACRGFFGTHLVDISQGAGIQKSTFFHYFADKEALYAEAVVVVLEGIASSLEQAIQAAGSFDAGLVAFLDVMEKASERYPQAPLLLWRALIEDRTLPLDDPASAARATGRIVVALKRLLAGRESGPNGLAVRDVETTSALASSVIAIVCAAPVCGCTAARRFDHVRTHIRQIVETTTSHELRAPPRS